MAKVFSIHELHVATNLTELEGGAGNHAGVSCESVCDAVNFAVVEEVVIWGITGLRAKDCFVVPDADGERLGRPRESQARYALVMKLFHVLKCVYQSSHLGGKAVIADGISLHVVAEAVGTDGPRGKSLKDGGISGTFSETLGCCTYARHVDVEAVNGPEPLNGRLERWQCLGVDLARGAEEGELRVVRLRLQQVDLAVDMRAFVRRVGDFHFCQ